MFGPSARVGPYTTSTGAFRLRFNVEEPDGSSTAVSVDWVVSTSTDPMNTGAYLVDWTDAGVGQAAHGALLACNPRIHGGDESLTTRTI